MGRVGSAIIIAPHPDDEVIGAAGLIQALVRRGARLNVVVVTDGAASHPDSRRWPRRRLVLERRRESRRAMRRLGVLPRRLHFLNLPDGALPSEQDRCAAAIRHMIRQIGFPNLLVGPAMEDAHPDHQAVAAALRRIRPPGRRLAYRVWPARRHKGRTFAVRGGSPAKRSLLRCYRTQIGAVRDDPAGFTMAPHELRMFSRPIERFEEIGR